jgi:hypothetical protein
MAEAAETRPYNQSFLLRMRAKRVGPLSRVIRFFSSELRRIADMLLYMPSYASIPSMTATKCDIFSSNSERR